LNGLMIAVIIFMVSPLARWCGGGMPPPLIN